MLRRLARTARQGVDRRADRHGEHLGVAVGAERDLDADHGAVDRRDRRARQAGLRGQHRRLGPGRLAGLVDGDRPARSPDRACVGRGTARQWATKLDGGRGTSPVARHSSNSAISSSLATSVKVWAPTVRAMVPGLAVATAIGSSSGARPSKPHSAASSASGRGKAWTTAALGPSGGSPSTTAGITSSGSGQPSPVGVVDAGVGEHRPDLGAEQPRVVDLAVAGRRLLLDGVGQHRAPRAEDAADRLPLRRREHQQPDGLGQRAARLAGLDDRHRPDGLVRRVLGVHRRRGLGILLGHIRDHDRGQQPGNGRTGEQGGDAGPGGAHVALATTGAFRTRTDHVARGVLGSNGDLDGRRSACGGWRRSVKRPERRSVDAVQSDPNTLRDRRLKTSLPWRSCGTSSSRPDPGGCPSPGR